MSRYCVSDLVMSSSRRQVALRRAVPLARSLSIKSNSSDSTQPDTHTERERQARQKAAADPGALSCRNGLYPQGPGESSSLPFALPSSQTFNIGH